MKTNNVLKIGFFAVAFALLSVGVKAQTPTTTPTLLPKAIPADYTSFTGRESIDTVTVSSRMPYMVEAQTPITGMTFEYKWLFSNGAAILNAAGTAITGNNDYYTANEISVVMPNAVTAGTPIKINTNVRSLVNGTVMCTAATDDVYNVEVVARPTIKWPANGRSDNCTATAVSIPLTLSGYKQFEVAYTMVYYPNVDKTGTTVTTTGYIVLAGNTLDFPATTFGSTGVYEITVTGITDRISRKSLDQTLVKSVASDLPNDAYNVYVYPAPQTKPLQHVKNM